MKYLLSLILIVSLSACGMAQQAKYSSLEKVGIHKRDILVNRIKDTSKTQEETKEQFKTAYEELAGLIDVNDNGLEKKYESMAKAVSASEDKAGELDARIKSVDQVATALFKEWQDELALYQSASLRRVSEQNMNSTKARYNQLYQTMLVSQQRIGPVLEVLQDNTLYLKHNLNARAISSISGEVLNVEDKVVNLIRQMEQSIAESNRFIEQMQNAN
ncbi:MAG: DUF2959 domain-containing protein [Acidiferrobacterales bacterium]|nr:DUF2959 domain-containing protein [Acidiferrobacterales bacterium]